MDVMTPTEERADLEKSCAWPEGTGPQGMCTTGGGGPTRVPNLCVRAPFDFWCGTRRGGRAKSRPAVHAQAKREDRAAWKQVNGHHVAKGTTVLTYPCPTAAVFSSNSNGGTPG